MISQTAEYALRALVWLAENNGSAQTTEQIAKEMQIPAGYLSKVLQILVRTRLVKSQRGIGGGYLLAQPASMISILDVFNAVDPIQRFPECPLGRKHAGEKLCTLHKKLDAAFALIEDTFRGCSLKDLCPKSGEDPLICPEKPDGGRE